MFRSLDKLGMTGDKLGMTGLKVLTDFCELLADAFERFQHLGLVYDILLLALEPLGRTFQGKAFDLYKKMDVLECLDILLGEKAVALGISLRLDEFREFICPETDQGCAFADDLGYFTYCVKILFHNYILDPHVTSFLGMTLVSIH